MYLCKLLVISCNHHATIGFSEDYQAVNLTETTKTKNRLL